MKIFMACPAPTGSRHGNRVTAERWAHIFRSLGHELTISDKYSDSPCDLMVALHARKSYSAIARYRKRYPKGPLIVALTGTDLYGDIRTSKRAQRSLELADRLIVLQPCGKDELPAYLRKKVRVIFQSVEPMDRTSIKTERWFNVCVLGHLREVKDPFRAAEALVLLPDSSRVQVLQVGKAMNAKMARRAKALTKEQPRYRWYGEVSRIQARRILDGSRLLVLSSIMEGGANVLSEAIVAGVPVLASRIPGNIGLLGSRYPGYFPVGDTLALMKLLHRAETDSSFYQKLKTSCEQRKDLFDPNREQTAWSQLLKNISKP